MNHLDLCTGIGGFHLAAEWAGFETIGFSEIDQYCCKLLAEKWPGIKNYGDLRTSDFSELRGRITVLSAGVPCQPSSVAGKRRGKADDRWLWPAVLDVVESVEPAWCIFENPPGILTLDEFGGVLIRLESLGYEVRAFSVPANAVGAKHRRQRVFIVAHAERKRRDGRSNGRRAAAGAGTSSEFMRAGGDAETLAYTTQGGLRQPGFPGLTESPLCGATPRVPDRSHRLKALGNAVVQQQAYPFFEAIAQVISNWPRRAN